MIIPFTCTVTALSCAACPAIRKPTASSKTPSWSMPRTQVEVEFTANDPGLTLFHCHQQNHMDAGFMMLFRYA